MQGISGEPTGIKNVSLSLLTCNEFCVDTTSSRACDVFDVQTPPVVDSQEKPLEMKAGCLHFTLMEGQL